MAGTPHPYTKLGGRGLRQAAFGVSVTRCQLWLAEDHLLSVDATFTSEEYRRFYYRDIEAFIIRRTARRMILNWVLGVFAFGTMIPVAIFYFSDRSVGALGAMLGAAAFWLGLFLYNNLRGATCQTHIRTAAQVEQLPSLSRIHATRKALARLRSLIVAAQGEATLEELEASPWMRSGSSR